MLCWLLTQCCNDDCEVATDQSSQLQGGWRLHQTRHHDAAYSPFNLVEALELDMPFHLCKRNDGESPISHSSVR